MRSISWYKFAKWGITFPFQNKDYNKTTNEERKTTDFTAIIKIVGGNRYKVGIFRDYRYEVSISLNCVIIVKGYQGQRERSWLFLIWFKFWLE